MKTITAAEALRALADGKSIISNWDERPAKIVGDFVKYPDGSGVGLDGILGAKNLRIYEEPKKKIEVALYAYLDWKEWRLSGHYYEDDLSFKAVVSHVRKFKRLDGTNGTQDTTMLVDEY